MNRAALTLVLALCAAACCAAQDTPALDTSPEHIADLIAKLDGEGMAQQVKAKAAYEELRKIGEPAIPQLVKAASCDKPWIRVWTAAALGASHDPRAVEPMLKLLDDPFVTVRKIATWHGAGLADLDPRITPAVVRRVGDPSAEVRPWAERALRERIRFKGTAAELAVLTRGDAPPVRALAYKLLVEANHEDPAAAIGKTLSEEKDWRVRSAAVRCLGNGAVESLEPAFDLAIRALDDTDDEVKADAVEVIEFALKDQKDSIPANLRKSVATRLEAKLPPLLDSPFPRLRGAALFLLAAGRGPALYDRAIKAVEDPSAEVRAYAFRALGRCGLKKPEVVSRAVACLGDEDLQVRRSAFAALCWAANTRFDYKPDDPADQRAKAVERIKAHLGP